MDMEGRIYISEVKKLLDDKKINISQIDEMVARILRVKFQLGLFDDPYQYCDVEKQNKLTMHPDHLAAARDIARKSFVLLKNEKNVLPLSEKTKKIAVIGPLANDKDAPTGNWRGVAEPNSAVSLLEGIKAAVGSKAEVLYAEGCKLVTNPSQSFFTQLNVNTSDRSGFAEAVEVAKKADVVVMALGETAYMSGECRSYADISLKGLQAELLREIRKTGKPIVLTLFNGRPMVLTDIIDQTDALLVCWLPGTESGHAIADVLFGDYNPSGKLPASFPYHVGQVPVYYEQMTSGRPYDPNPEGFSTKYRDIPNAPLYAFGKGLSYTTFEYKNLRLSKTQITKDGSLTASVLVTNTGTFDGEEVVQLYIRDVVGKGISRPVQQLKGFEKVMLRKGETREVTFNIAASDLAFWRLDNTWAPEEGDFMLMVGSASDDIRLKEKFVLKN
ncbi:MAG TPA: glycoside hydrolase family 3 C-terminal domain-containing protein [Bacteroidales bacterium]|nr:glycoside hydrolase family 3 C-terminal domain-containing protein [Bacteroidales bacterium]